MQTPYPQHPRRLSRGSAFLRVQVPSYKLFTPNTIIAIRIQKEALNTLYVGTLDRLGVAFCGVRRAAAARAALQRFRAAFGLAGTIMEHTVPMAPGTEGFSLTKG